MIWTKLHLLTYKKPVEITKKMIKIKVQINHDLNVVIFRNFYMYEMTKTTRTLKLGNLLFKKLSLL